MQLLPAVSCDVRYSSPFPLCVCLSSLRRNQLSGDHVCSTCCTASAPRAARGAFSPPAPSPPRKALIPSWRTKYSQADLPPSAPPPPLARGSMSASASKLPRGTAASAVASGASGGGAEVASPATAAPAAPIANEGGCAASASADEKAPARASA